LGFDFSIVNNWYIVFVYLVLQLLQSAHIFPHWKIIQVKEYYIPESVWFFFLSVYY